MRWLLLTLLAPVAGLLVFNAREPPRTRAAARPSACERVVTREPPPNPHDEPAEETASLPPATAGPGSSRPSPYGFRVVTGVESQPVPGARAWVTRYDGREWMVRRVTSDTRGEVVLPPEFRESLMVLVRKTGYTPHLEGVHGGMPKKVRLRPGPPLRGRVILNGGAPVEGARVYAWDRWSDAGIVWRQIEGDTPGWSEFTLTDRSGCFEIDGIADEFDLCVIAAGYGVYRSEHEPVREVLVILRRGGEVEGRVFDDEGRPVAAASVYAEQTSGNRDYGFEFGSVSRYCANAHTETGPDGTYRIVGLPPARYVVTASKGPWARGDSCPVQLTEGACAFRCVTLERSATLQVQAEGGHRRLRCRLRRPDGQRVWSRLWGNAGTPNGGVFEGVPAGSYDLHVSARSGGPEIVRRIELRPGETLRVTARLPRP